MPYTTTVLRIETSGKLFVEMAALVLAAIG
jgi:hypothetical protein